MRKQNKKKLWPFADVRPIVCDTYEYSKRYEVEQIINHTFEGEIPQFFLDFDYQWLNKERTRIAVVLMFGRKGACVEIRGATWERWPRREPGWLGYGSP